MTSRRRIVRVPASSANLGPGYDVLGAALSIFLELEVSEVGEFSIDPGDPALPADRGNLIVKAFETLHPADGLRFQVRNEIPLARGMGSSAAAILSGLLAADHLFELGNSREQILAAATEIEGHPDNVAAALYGGIAVCPPPGSDARMTPPDPIEIGLGTAPTAAVAPIRLEPPQGVEGVVVIPADQVSTELAREAMPAEVPLADATYNVAAAAQLVLGIERSDLGLIDRGLSDRLHQDRRRHLYPRSMEIVERARDFGAVGATISGSGPTVLIWSYWQGAPGLAEALSERTADWAEVRRAPFSPLGASVEM